MQGGTGKRSKRMKAAKPSSFVISKTTLIKKTRK
jgi:hypothetical protein